MNKQPTMKDVARRAGVTQPTVSYVINGTASVTQEVRQKVWQAVEELGYTPNVYARVLRTQRSNIAAILIPDISNQHFASLVGRLENAFSGRFTSLIASTRYDRFEEEKIINQFLSYNAEVIILTYQLMNPNCWALLRQSGCRVIAIECGAAADGFFSINTDNRYGGYIATKRLLDDRRTKIAYVGQNVHSDTLLERQRGYCEAMREAGCEPVIFNTVSAGNFWQEGSAFGERIVRDRYDGVVTSTDILAVGILRHLLACGVRVPEDVAVIGYDDIPLAELFVPPLTTVRQPTSEICDAVVDAVDAQKCTGDLIIKPELVCRATAK